VFARACSKKLFFRGYFQRQFWRAGPECDYRIMVSGILFGPGAWISGSANDGCDRCLWNFLWHTAHLRKSLRPGMMAMHSRIPSPVSGFSNSLPGIDRRMHHLSAVAKRSCDKKNNCYQGTRKSAGSAGFFLLDRFV